MIVCKSALGALRCLAWRSTISGGVNFGTFMGLCAGCLYLAPLLASAHPNGCWFWPLSVGLPPFPWPIGFCTWFPERPSAEACAPNCYLFLLLPSRVGLRTVRSSLLLGVKLVAACWRAWAEPLLSMEPVLEGSPHARSASSGCRMATCRPAVAPACPWAAWPTLVWEVEVCPSFPPELWRAPSTSFMVSELCLD